VHYSISELFTKKTTTTKTNELIEQRFIEQSVMQIPHDRADRMVKGDSSV